MAANECLLAISRRTPMQRFFDRLYPRRSVPIPDDLEGFAPSYMVTGVTVQFDWKDRLRLLASGKLEVQIQTKTDVIVRKMLSTSIVSVLPPGASVNPSPA